MVELIRVRATRTFVDNDGTTYVKGRVFDWPVEKAEHYLGRTGPGHIVELAEEGIEEVIAEGPVQVEPLPKQTLAEAIAGNNVATVLRLVDAGHVEAHEALLIEQARPEEARRVTLVRELEKRVGGLRDGE